MAEPRYRVLVIGSHPVQYMSLVLRRMAQHPQLEPSVAYCTLRGVEAAHDPEFGATVKWDIPLLDGYNWVHVPSRGSGDESFFGLCNPGLWRQLGSHVRFLGRLAEEQVMAFAAQAVAVVVPSLGGEVFGMVVAENMVLGLPVIASDLGAFVEVLGGTGQLFRTGDAADHALQMGRILDDPALGQRFAAAARQRIQETFAEQRMIEGHSRIYQELRRTATAVHTDIPWEP